MRICNIKSISFNLCQYSSKNDSIASLSYRIFLVIWSDFPNFKSTFSQLDFKKLMQFSYKLKILNTNQL